MATFLSDPQSNGSEYFENCTYSSHDFYAEVENIIRSKKVPDVHCSRINLSETTSLLSAKREYLRIQRKQDCVDICAAPFANSFFVSSWVGEEGSPILDLLCQIPIVGRLFIWIKKRNMTYFEADSIAMFKEMVSHAIGEAKKKMTESKGSRMHIDAVTEQQPS